MCLMIIKCSIPEAFWGSILRGQSARKFLEEIGQFFVKNEKAETSNLLAKFISTKYKCRGNIREYIMEMSNLVAKLKSLKLDLDEDFGRALGLISLPAYLGQFKVSYNTQKDKWSLKELISHCVQEKERKNIKVSVEGSSKGKKLKKNEEFTCFFCKKSGHMKKQCLKLQLKIGFHMNLFETFVVSFFRKNLIFISSLDKIEFSYSFGNNKVSLYQNSNIAGSGDISKQRIQRLVSDEILEPLNLSNFEVCVECIKEK
ncbi:hypothetical protein CR513_49002, partial [Mucuna pruriens]